MSYHHEDDGERAGSADSAPPRPIRRLAVLDQRPAEEAPNRALGITRRAWMELTTATLAAAALAGCDRDPIQKILPYTVEPADAVPGTTHHFATSASIEGHAFGLIVESHEGRPTKIEGNPAHPASLGATGLQERSPPSWAFMIRTALDPSAGEGGGTWEAFAERFGGERSDGGEGLRFLVEPTSSPLVLGLIARVKARHPKARFTYQGALGTGPDEGARLAFGAPVTPSYDLRKARVIVAFSIPLS